MRQLQSATENTSAPAPAPGRSLNTIAKTRQRGCSLRLANKREPCTRVSVATAWHQACRNGEGGNMRILLAGLIYLGLIASAEAFSQKTPIFIEDLFEYKVIIGVGPIKPIRVAGKVNFDLSAEMEREIEDMAIFVCSIFGRYAYPINVTEENCDALSLFANVAPGKPILCMKRYMYACGTHQID